MGTDIGRGRDHGIPAYVYYVQYCTGIRITCWEDLYELIEPGIVQQLRAIYKQVNIFYTFINCILM